jgi:glycosyltransferase involved in cell wall biosynthesis
MPILSIVVFCRNCEKTLDAALESTLSQRCDLELLVLDGGSTDSSVEIIRKFERHIAFWRSFPDGSSTNAIIEGVRRATGRAVGLLAGDDWYEPNSLRSVAKRFEDDPSLDVLSCGTRFAYYDDRGEFRSEKRFVRSEQLSFTLENLFRDPLTCGRFIKKSAYDALGGYSAAFKSSDDLDFLIRLYLSRPKTAVHNGLTYTYRAHPGSRTLSGDLNILLAMARDNVTIAEKYLPAPSLSTNERSALLALHGKFAARGAWNSLRCGRPTESAEFVKRALEKNVAWPLMVPFWFVAGLGRKFQGEQLK